MYRANTHQLTAINYLVIPKPLINIGLK